MVVVFIKPHLPPLYLIGIPDVHVFNTNGIAIDLIQVVQDFLKGAGFEAQDTSRIKYGVQIFLTKSEIFYRKGRCIGASGPYRIGLGEKMSPCSVTVNEVNDFEFL